MKLSSGVSSALFTTYDMPLLYDTSNGCAWMNELEPNPTSQQLTTRQRKIFDLQKNAEEVAFVDSSCITWDV